MITDTQPQQVQSCTLEKAALKHRVVMGTGALSLSPWQRSARLSR